MKIEVILQKVKFLINYFLVPVAGYDSANELIRPLAVDATGQVKTTTTVTSESTAEASAAAPTYSEGQDAPLSQDLSGNLRVIDKTLSDKVGEVQASPTANTVLDRLKALLTGIAALATSAQIGEVQASPTSNTVLDRLKALLTGIVLAAGTAIIGKVGVDQTTDGTTNRTFPIRRGALTSKSGTADGTSQTVAASNATRSYFAFQNPSGNMGTMWVSPTGATATAASPQIEVKPGQGFKWDSGFVPTGAITIIGTNTEKWTAYEG